MSSHLIPGHDRLLDDPYQRDMDARAAEGDDDLDESCIFCESTRHESSDCPHADESIEEDLW